MNTCNCPDCRENRAETPEAKYDARGRVPVRSNELVSWRVSIHEKTCIVFAATKAKAQWIAVRSYWDAYDRNGWPPAKAVRADYDQSRLRFERQQAWCEDYVRDCLNVVTPANDRHERRA